MAILLSVVFRYFLDIQGALGQDISEAIRFRLTNTATGNYDECTICFQPGASAGYDGAHDVHKAFDDSNADPVLYTRTEEGHAVSLNTYPRQSHGCSIDIYAQASTDDSLLLECEVTTVPGTHREIYIEDLASGRIYEYVRDLHVGFHTTGSADNGARFRVHFSGPASARMLKASCPGMNSGIAVISDPGNPAFGYTLLDAAGNMITHKEGLPGVDTLTGLAPGAYVVVTHSAHGASDTLALDITLQEDIRFEGTITHVSETGLADGAIDLAVSGQGPFAFRWFDGPDTEDRNGLCSGQYQVTITNAASCAKKVIFHVEYPGMTGEEPPVSINLLWFRAVNEHDSAIRLEWSTASEFLSGFFTVEHLNEHSTWEEVAVVEGAGMSAAQRGYEAVDRKPKKGMNYYRLKQTDLLDAVVYSDTVCVPVGMKPDAGFSKLELLSFAVSLNPDGHVLVQWTTAEESGNDYFTVERSADNRYWEEVQRVEGAGGDTDTISYAVVDERSPAGTAYYRLEQTSPDGSSTHSQIAQVHKRAPAAMGIRVYPIPATRELFVEGIDPGHKPMIQDQCGKTVMMQGRLNGKTLSYDVSGLSEGLYFITTGTPGAEYPHRFIVLK